MKMSVANENEDSLKTADFVLATFLFASLVPLLEINPTNDPRRVVFVFKRVDSLDVLIRSFEARQELIEPIQLLSAQRELKRRLHDFQERQELERRNRA